MNIKINVTTVHVRVLDADDQNPGFYFDRYSAQIPDMPGQGVKLQTSPQNIQAFDKDLGKHTK